jgi:hypothetical protein
MQFCCKKQTSFSWFLLGLFSHKNGSAMSPGITWKIKRSVMFNSSEISDSPGRNELAIKYKIGSEEI